jgi:hypothetical protein
MAFLPNIQGIRVTGSLTGMTSITVTGNTNLASVTANTLTVTGNTRLAGLTATTISAGTYSNLPNTLYTGNGTLSGNRLVDIGGNQLYFSGAANTNALMINTSGVGIKTSSPNYNLEVNGTVGIAGIFNQGGLSSNAVSNGSFVHGSNNIGVGIYTHVEGFGNSTAQTGYRLNSVNLVNGVITVVAIDLTSYIFSNDYLVIDDRNYGNVIGINIFKVKSVSLDVSDTIITLDNTSLNTTDRFILGILRTYQFASSDEAIDSDYSHSEGYKSISVGDYSHAEGSGSTSMGTYSHAEGALTVSSGDYSHSEGFDTKTFGSHSHAEGNSTYTLIDGSHAEGLSAFTGQYGYETEPNISSGTILIKSIYGNVSSQISDTGGKNILIYDDTLFDNVYGLAAFRIGAVGFDGTNTTVTLDFNLNSTLAAYISPVGNSVPLYADKIIGSGYSHSEGVSTKALGYGSHAQGSGTTSVGKYSFATGIGTIADVDGMAAVGKYNTISNSDTLFVIGNGDESGTSNLAVFRNNQITFSQPLELTSNNPLTITSLPNNSTNSLLLSVDGSGLVSSYGISNIGIGRFLSLSGGTVTGATTFTGGLSANTISGGTYLGNGSGLTGVFNSVRINNTTQFSAGTNTFINFSGVNISILSGTGNTLVFSASTSTPSVASGAFLPLSGGTVTGGTIFTSGVTANTLNVTGNTLLSGLTANTISATTYLNLPSSAFTGGTVSGATDFTNGLTAATISATTYQNLPQDIFVTGGTYTSGNVIFTNNSGGTFTVTGFAVGGGGGQTFYLNLSQSQGGNRLLSTTASTASEQTSGVTISNGVTSTIASFQTTPLNISLIPGGIWSFYLHSYKENNNASFNIFVEVYKITSGGSQTLLFATDPAPVTTNSPNPSMQLSDGYFSGTPLSVSDSIVAVVRATNTGNQSHIITLVTEGSQHYSYVVSTIPTQQGLTCETLSGCSIIQTINTDISNKFDKSGGTVNGATIFTNGLTANTISAQTYENVNAVTGGTYNSGTGTITLSGTGNVNGNTITGIMAGGGTTWQYATSPITASTGNGYITTGTTSIALPTVAALGSAIEVISASDDLFTITQSAGQLIRFGIVTTTQGAGGTLVSQNNGDSIKLICTSANTVFTVAYAVGTLTLN